ncbi:MAG: cupredoxin domain-containing protein [Actinomycetota bacterium]|nr:cupredoxin domain-containing protein [Actinomycetota bacterium]
MRRMVLVMVAAALALAGCGDGEDRPGTVTPEGSGTGTGSASGTHTGSASGTGPAGPAFGEAQANSVVDVALHDFSFVGIPATVKGPKVFFKAINRGPADHELEILDAGGKAVGEVEAMANAKSGTLAVELKPGTYTAQCLVETGGKTHVELGMKTSFQIT